MKCLLLFRGGGGGGEEYIIELGPTTDKCAVLSDLYTPVLINNNT